MRAWQRRWHLVSPTLYNIMVYRVNLNKLSQNFVGALRTTTTNCRVSFIDLYLVFARNFRIVFLPHINTVILLEPYCSTITEPGLPVVTETRLCESESIDFIPQLLGYCFEFVKTPLSAGGVGFFINENYKYRVLERSTNSS